MKNLRRWLWNEKGNVLLFTTVLVVPLMIIFGGLALDLAHLGTVDDEVQRSLDAAALAGAGQLGFNSSVFPAARAWAQNYALLNPIHNQSYPNPTGAPALATINLNLNTANVPNGDIVLGIWNGSSFTPSLDPTQVNAVLCRHQTTVDMTFLRLLGFTSLPVAGEAIAWASQPATVPDCPFPIALSQCFFGVSNPATTLGCGAPVTFISSSSGSAVGGNSAAWASIVPGQIPNDPNILAQIQAAAGAPGAACSGSQVSTGNSVPVNNGQLNNVVNWLIANFPAIYNASPPTITVLAANGTNAYVGKGWEVYAPVINTGAGCPPGTIVGSLPIVGWARMVITQIQGKNGECAVANHWTGNPWDAHCLDTKNGTASSLPPGWAGQTGIYGYYDCQYIPAPPSTVAGPISATARLRLVR
jgi:Flp pilus assembly protein TadG